MLDIKDTLPGCSVFNLHLGVVIPRGRDLIDASSACLGEWECNISDQAQIDRTGSGFSARAVGDSKDCEQASPSRFNVVWTLDRQSFLIPGRR